MFKNVHPTIGRNHTGPVQSKAVNYGRNLDNTVYSDDKYVRCRQCGFMCHLDRDMKAPDGSRVGDGIKHTAIDDSDADEPSVASGCPQCGSYNYE